MWAISNKLVDGAIQLCSIFTESFVGFSYKLLIIIFFTKISEDELIKTLEPIDFIVL